MGGDNGGPGDLAIKYGFALVCGEALQYNEQPGPNMKSGVWKIPEIITNSTGTPCEESDSMEVGYITNAISALDKGVSGLPKFDTTRIFTSGCSMGSAHSSYQAQCIKQRSPSILSAFATHSTGLKIKGDGNNFPPDEYNTQYTWGECPKCEYFPFCPKAYTDTLGLKACVFDNTGDGDFYKSSQALGNTWKDLGMKAETHFESGGHCQIHSFEEIVNCLDDGSKRLLSGGPIPTPSPSPPSPGPSPGPPSPGPEPSQACQKCFVRHCGGTRPYLEPCKSCVQTNQQTCAPSCASYPFQELMAWFCHASNSTLIV